jgi:hypothetical protein
MQNFFNEDTEMQQTPSSVQLKDSPEKSKQARPGASREDACEKKSALSQLTRMKMVVEPKDSMAQMTRIKMTAAPVQDVVEQKELIGMTRMKMVATPVLLGKQLAPKEEPKGSPQSIASDSTSTGTGCATGTSTMTTPCGTDTSLDARAWHSMHASAESRGAAGTINTLAMALAKKEEASVRPELVESPTDRLDSQAAALYRNQFGDELPESVTDRLSAHVNSSFEEVDTERQHAECHSRDTKKLEEVRRQIQYVESRLEILKTTGTSDQNSVQEVPKLTKMRTSMPLLHSPRGQTSIATPRQSGASIGRSATQNSLHSRPGQTRRGANAPSAAMASPRLQEQKRGRVAAKSPTPSGGATSPRQGLTRCNSSRVR